LFGDSSRCLKRSPSWKTLFSINRRKEFGMISTVNRSEGSDIGQLLDIVVGMMISDIVVEIIIFRV
jgi:tetrahydromethanopterin S-methyltransferase subunit G